MTKALVILNENNVPTTSFQVAKAFDKRHDNVMASIKTIMTYLKNNGLALLNFKECSRTYNGREFPMYEMDRNAYSQLVGSFTGEKATIFRKKYADAFDGMEEELKRRQQPKRLSRMEILQMAIESEQEALELRKEKAPSPETICKYDKRTWNIQRHKDPLHRG